MSRENHLYLFLRYIALVLIALPSLNLFYLVFTPLTVYPSFWILRALYPSLSLSFPCLSSLNPDSIACMINSHFVDIIPACIAGSAFYLLLILNLSTPMETGTRVKSISFLLASLLCLNVIRLVVFSALFFSGFEFFDILHKGVWLFGSTLFVVALWFANVSIFKIKSIPVYDDFKRLFKDIRPAKRGKKK